METLAPLADGINRMVEPQERILEGQNLMLEQMGQHTEQMGQHTELLQAIVGTLQDHSVRLASIEARLGDT